MKRFILTVALSVLGTGTALAQAQAVGISGSDSVANSAAQNAGNTQGITFNSDASGRIKNVPSMGGNGFYGSFSPDSCTVSGGGSVAFAGFGGSVASPVRDEACELYRGVERSMQVSATFQALGDDDTAARLRQGAIDLLCQVSDESRAAFTHQGLCSNLNPNQITAPVARARPVEQGVTVPQVTTQPVSIPQVTVRYRINADGAVARVQ